MAECGFHNAGNQRFSPINKEALNRDLEELEKTTNELVRAQMRRLLEEFFSQQKKRKTMTLLR